jgi:hypothetical protein
MNVVGNVLWSPGVNGAFDDDRGNYAVYGLGAFNGGIWDP